MQIENWNINDIKPYENNPRENDEAAEYVANSIKEFGFQQPIVVDKNGIIIAGHTRWKAAQQLGLKEVPVVVADELTQNQIDAYRLADNKVSEFSGWDFDKLNLELEGIDWLDIDMTKFGFYLDKENEGDEGLDDKYSQEIGTIVYEPREGINWEIKELYDYDVDDYIEVIDQIENEELKEMLKLRMAWFAKFNFKRIADYYAYQANETEQYAIERLGLVLLDKNQCIEHGYYDFMNLGEDYD